nr:hypothetical protein [Tanacetum cinerariifolium]
MMIRKDPPLDQTGGLKDKKKEPRRPPSPDRDWNKTLLAAQGDAQSWISDLARQTDARSSFNKLLDTPIDFSNFIMNRLNVDTLTPELLVYKATTDQLDWVNPEGQQYPHNLLQPLPLIPDNRGRRVIPFDHFINNDLEYLWGGALSSKYTTSVTKTKAADYGHIKWIKDLVPRAMRLSHASDDDSDETVKAGSKKDKDYDDNDDDDDDDEEEELAKNDEEDTETGKGGDEVSESEGESDEEETRQEEEGSFDPIPRTPEGSEEESNNEEDKELRLSEEARIQEEEEADELYHDININQGRGLQVTQNVEDSHVTITPVNPDGPQGSSSMSSFVTSMLNSTSDVGVESIFTTASSLIVSLQTPTPIMTPSIIATITTSGEAPIPPPTIPSIILENLLTFNLTFRFDKRLRSLETFFSEYRQTNLFVDAVSAIPSIVQHDVGVESIFTTTSSPIVSLQTPTPIMTPSTITTITTSSEVPIPPPTIPSIILENLLTFNSAFRFKERLRSLETSFSEYRQTNPFADAVFAIPGIVQQFMTQQMTEAVREAVQI